MATDKHVDVLKEVFYKKLIINIIFNKPTRVLRNMDAIPICLNDLMSGMYMLNCFESLSNGTLYPFSNRVCFEFTGTAGGI